MSEKLANGSAGWTDPDDAPELDDAFFDKATFEIGGVRVTEAQFWAAERAALAQQKVRTHLELDADIVAHFKAAGPDWRTRINAALRSTMKRAS